jgi:hypothetical protein
MTSLTSWLTERDAEAKRLGIRGGTIRVRMAD